jgi:hypothetical protein
MWHELRIAMDDGRKGLHYAPYLMFMIERVTGYKLRRMVSTPSTRLRRPKPQVLAGP